jgi:Ca-activated chloride channel homolog
MFRDTAFAAGLLLAAAASPLAAQGWIEIERPINTPVPANGGVVRVSSTVHTTVEGHVARIEVVEEFRNLGGAMAEGNYLYPLPGEAVFSGFSLWMGDKEVRGETMNAEQARAIYEEIVRRKRDPALLSLAGTGLVRAQVFPIQPGETRKVMLRYTQVLERAGDALRVRYNLGQRDGGRTGWGDRRDAASGRFSWQLEIPASAEFGTPYSPTHQLTTRRESGRLEISLDPGASGEVEVFLPLRRNLVGTSVVTYAPGGEDGYYMLLLAPPPSGTADALPRDVSLVVDVSGSMSGAKIEQAREALDQALGTLGPRDRFRVIAFSSSVHQFQVGFVTATPDHIAEARRFVAGLQAEGGTNIAGALDVALDGAVPEERVAFVIFLTDGVPSVGEQAPDRIAEAAGARVGRRRLFTFGVGTDVNTYLLDRLAVQGHGAAAYVAPDANVEVAVGSLLGKIQHPALANLRIVSAPVTFAQMTPANLPDLFYGEELVVFGRYHGHGDGDVVLEGERNGRRERFVATASFPSTDDRDEFVSRLWASRRIGELTRQARLEGASESLVAQIRDLGLRYGILTEYTSYLVQEPEAVAGQLPPQGNLPATLRGGAAAAPSQTGVMAFRRAEGSAKMAEADNLAAADSVAVRQLADARSDAGASSSARRVGSRVFVQRKGVWTDATWTESVAVLTVAPYSAAYFGLARALPEIRPGLGLGEPVLISGRRIAIRVADGGLMTLSPDKLSSTVREFRGR